jgi:DNA-binding LacI/PurR family transcriptional regulator
MSTRKAITVRSIAKLCNVSTATVSRVINNDPRVSEKTRKKVQQAMEEQQYIFPTKKRTLPESDFKKIGLIFLSDESDYYVRLIHHIILNFMKQGIRPICANTELAPNYLPTALETLYSSGVSGIIFISCGYQEVKPYLHPDIAHVWIDCNDPESETADILQVQSDHYISGQLAAQELWKKGCRQPILLTSTNMTHRAIDRISGFKHVYQKTGRPLPDDHIIYLPCINNHFQESKDIIQYLIAKHFPFDSIFAINDWRSLGASLGVKSMNLRIPEDIKIIGFDGISMTANSILNITSIQQNTELISRIACELLIKEMNHETIPQKRRIVPTNLVEGQTT